VSALLFSLMLAARPTVAVEVQPSQRATDIDPEAMITLRGWLVRRLLEEGYDVAADPAGAHGVVHLRPASDGLVVEAQGRGQRSFAVEGGPEAVLRLEVLHRALLGVEQTCDARAPLAEPEPGLALRFVDGALDEALLEAMAVVADDAGVTLTDQPRPGDTVACVERRGSLAEVALGPAEAECGLPLLVLDLADGSTASYRHAASELIDVVHRSAANDAGPEATGEVLDMRTLGGPGPSDPMPGIVVELDDDGELVAMHGPARAEMRVGLSAGVATRGPNADALIQAGWRAGKIRGVGGRLSLSVVPSSGENIRVVDSRLVIGPDWELKAGERGHVDFAALVGTDIHTFAVGDRTAADVAFAAELPVSYAYTLRGSARLHLVVTPGISTTTWEHRSGVARDDRIRWARPSWRIGVGVAISHGWRIE